jgi:hypothetical protein
MNDAIPVTLKTRAMRAFFFGKQTPARLAWV